MSSTQEQASLREKLAKKKQLLVVTNPSTLLPFETARLLAGLEPVAEDEVAANRQANASLIAEMRMLDNNIQMIRDSYSPNNNAELYLSPMLADLAERAIYINNTVDDEEAELKARELLAKSPAIVDAYNVLGQRFAKTHEHALQYFQKAEAVAPQLISGYKRRLPNELGWESGVMRPVLRAVLGQANTLRKMGRYEDALNKYQQLERMDPHWHPVSSGANFRYFVPTCLLAMGRFKDCQKYFDTHKHAANLFSFNSSVIAYVLNQAFLDFQLLPENIKARGGLFGHSNFEKNKAKMDSLGYKWIRGSCGLAAVMRFGKALQYLFDEIPMPQLALTTGQLGNPNSWTASLHYTQFHYRIWHDHPEALDWLRRVRNTYWAIQHIRTVQIGDNHSMGQVEAERRARLATVMPVRDGFGSSLVVAKFFKRCISGPGSIFLCKDAFPEIAYQIVIKMHNVEYLRLLLEYCSSQFDVNFIAVSSRFTLLHDLCRNQFPAYDMHTDKEHAVPQLARLLLKAGAKVADADIAAACTHGNWQLVALLLLHEPAGRFDTHQLAELVQHSPIRLCVEQNESCESCRQMQDSLDKLEKIRLENEAAGTTMEDNTMSELESLALLATHPLYTSFDKTLICLRQAKNSNVLEEMLKQEEEQRERGSITTELLKLIVLIITLLLIAYMAWDYAQRRRLL